jgi:hypothetical protein
MKNSITLILAVLCTFSIASAQVKAPKSPNSTKNVSTDCVSGDCQNGWGYKNFSYGYYEGFWKNGKRHGYGLFDWEESGKYIGFWLNDKMTGYGTYLGDSMDMVGEFEDGFIQGLGYIVEDDEWEQGVYNLSQLEEAYTFYDNGVSTGCTAGDCQNRYGRYKWSNGDSFTGFFKNGNMYMGTYLYSNGDKYTGTFNSDNQFDGEGRFFFINGEYYGGKWKNGNYHGRGYFHDKNYNQKIGEWSNGTLVTKLN